MQETSHNNNVREKNSLNLPNCIQKQLWTVASEWLGTWSHSQRTASWSADLSNRALVILVFTVRNAQRKVNSLFLPFFLNSFRLCSQPLRHHDYYSTSSPVKIPVRHRRKQNETSKTVKCTSPSMFDSIASANRLNREASMFPSFHHPSCKVHSGSLSSRSPFRSLVVSVLLYRKKRSSSENTVTTSSDFPIFPTFYSHKSWL